MDATPFPDRSPRAASRRLALRLLLLAVGVLLLLAVFAAYRQPGFVLDFANLLLC